MQSDATQKLVDRTPHGGTLILDPPNREFKGPLVIRKPMTIVGQNGTVWATEGPVISIESSGVLLEKVNIEVTGNEKDLLGDAACAIVMAREVGVTLKDVCVRGNIRGLRGEEGDWLYPRAIRMKLRPNEEHDFDFKILSPVTGSLISQVVGLRLQPGDFTGGAECKVSLSVEALPSGTRLRGCILIKTGVARRIAILGNVLSEGAAKPDCKVEYWDTTGAETPPSKPKSDTASVSSSAAPKPGPKDRRSAGTRGTTGIPPHIKHEKTIPQARDVPDVNVFTPEPKRDSSRPDKKKPTTSGPVGGAWAPEPKKPENAERVPQPQTPPGTGQETAREAPVSGQTRDKRSEPSAADDSKGPTQAHGPTASRSSRRITPSSSPDVFGAFGTRDDVEDAKSKPDGGPEQSVQEEDSKKIGDSAKSGSPSDPKKRVKRRMLGSDGLEDLFRREEKPK